MSFVITVYVPEAVVMASDSRQFVSVETRTPAGETSRVQTVSSDFAFKTFLLEGQRVGITTYGADFLDGITMESHIRRFSEEHLADDDHPESVAQKLLSVFRQRFPSADTGFHVAGFRKEENTSIPYVYECHVGRNTMVRRNVNPQGGQVVYGAAWSGQPDVMTRLLNTIQVRGPDGKPQPFQAAPVIWQAMNIEDAIEFAIYAVRTTIDAMRFEARPKNVGGPIDVLVLTPVKVFWAQRKKLLGEP